MCPAVERETERLRERERKEEREREGGGERKREKRGGREDSPRGLAIVSLQAAFSLHAKTNHFPTNRVTVRQSALGQSLGLIWHVQR